MLYFPAVFLAVAAQGANGAYTFMSVGDWGGNALNETYYTSKKNVAAVASGMARYAKQNSPKFVVSTGDNFYWCGIENTTDYQINVDWVQPFQKSSPALDLPWYGVLGNHEYGYNPQAQVDMASMYKNWIMDDRYYTKRIKISPGNYMSWIFIDTSPCVQEYRSSSKSGWDPCGTEYPTCSITGGSDDFEGPCTFNENILAQDCSEQYDWFKDQLNSVPANDWLFVVGHHPLDELDVEDFVTPLQNRGFDMYLNGHVHTLTRYTVDNTGAYITTGAGSLVNTADQNGGSPAKDVTQAKALGKSDFVNSAGHTYQTVWNQKVAGFTSHQFGILGKKLTTNFYNGQGKKIYSFSVTKNALKQQK